MNCPVCKNPFIIIERNKIEVDYCINCNGIWLDNGEMELLSEILGLDSNIPNPYELPQIKTQENLLKCPYCRMIMKKVELNGVIVDVCANEHGVWFDKGELSKVLNHDKVTQYGKVVEFLGEVFKK